MAKRIINILFYIIAIFYIFMLVDLFFRFSYIFDADRIISRSYNLIPFKTIMDYASGSNPVSASNALSNILWNIVVFIPYGLYARTIMKRRLLTKSLLTVIVTAMAIELIQYVFGLGVGDIDDVLLNSLGGLLGISAYALLRRIFKYESRTKTCITIISVLFGVPVIYLYFTTVFGNLRL